MRYQGLAAECGSFVDAPAADPGTQDDVFLYRSQQRCFAAADVTVQAR